MDHAKRCTDGYSQFGIYGGYALPHMIIGQLELIMLAHALDWLPAMTIFTFGPSIIYRTSANPFQTLGPSPTKFRSHDRYTPFMCRPGHSNMLAQTIPKSRPTHYLRVISNLGRDRLAHFYQANVQPDWTALSEAN